MIYSFLMFSAQVDEPLPMEVEYDTNKEFLVRHFETGKRLMAGRDYSIKRVEKRVEREIKEHHEIENI